MLEEFTVEPTVNLWGLAEKTIAKPVQKEATLPAERLPYAPEGHPPARTLKQRPCRDAGT